MHQVNLHHPYVYCDWLLLRALDLADLLLFVIMPFNSFHWLNRIKRWKHSDWTTVNSFYCQLFYTNPEASFISYEPRPWFFSSLSLTILRFESRSDLVVPVSNIPSFARQEPVEYLYTSYLQNFRAHFDV